MLSLQLRKMKQPERKNTMQKFIFGARSEIPANKKLTNGYTLFDWAVRQNCFPAFWGRPISGEHAIKKEEIEFLAERDCGVLLVFDDLTLVGIAQKDGSADAERAISAAKALGAEGDGKTAIFAEIKENMNVNHNWMLSFAAGLKENGFVAGFIGNTDSSENFNFDSEFSHLVVAGGKALCFATRPETNEHVYGWTPYSPSALPVEEMAFWQNGKKNFNGLEYNTVYAKDETLLEHIFTLKQK